MIGKLAHGALTRRGIGVALAMAIAAAVVVPAFAGAAATPPKATTIVRGTVSKPGTYLVVVSLPAATPAQTVDVYAGTQVQRSIQLQPWVGSELAFYLRLHGRTFHVRTVTAGKPVHFRIATKLQPGGSSIPVVTGPTGTTGTTGSTGTTGATGASGLTLLNTTASPPYHHLVWSDEFNGPAGSPPNPKIWIPDVGGGCGANTLSTNTTSTANAAADGNGHLAIAARRDGSGGYTSAQLDSQYLFSFTYGRIEARINVPPGQGLCSAFWLLGDGATPLSPPCWPQCGEVDILEAVGNYPDAVSAFLHGPMVGVPNYQQFASGITAATSIAGGFHTYGLDWSPNSLTWTLDGIPYATATPKDLPKGARWAFNGHSFHVIFDLAVGGWPGAPSAATSFPARMYVDWVRLYQ